MLSKLIDPSTNEKVNFMEDEKKGVDRFDWTLAFILFLFLVVSLIAISSAQTHGQYVGNFVFQQVVWYGVGAFIIAFAMLLNLINIKSFPGYYMVSVYLYSYFYILHQNPLLNQETVQRVGLRYQKLGRFNHRNL